MPASLEFVRPFDANLCDDRYICSCLYCVDLFKILCQVFFSYVEDSSKQLYKDAFEEAKDLIIAQSAREAKFPVSFISQLELLLSTVCLVSIFCFSIYDISFVLYKFYIRL